ncbi:MAG: hypothetical protein NC935_08285, partial [Candidatus Omnitrophica bacterium]|nr:hypothetical protein [Candidatus Omnitrophota bacterium]
MVLNLYSLPLFISSIFFIFLGIFIFIKNKRYISTSFLCWVTFIWLFAYGMMYLSSEKETALFWAKIGYAGVIFWPVTFYHFIDVFLKGKRKHIVFMFYGLGIIFTISLFISNYFITDMYQFFWGYYPKVGFLQYIYITFFLLVTTISFIRLFLKYRNETYSIRRTQIQFLLFAFFVALPGIIDFLPNYGLKIYPCGYIFALGCVSILAYTIIKHHLMDIRIFISAATAFIFSYPFLLSIPFFFAYRMYPVLYPYLGIHWWLVPSGLLLFFAVTAPIAYNQIRKRMEDVLLADQKRYHKLLLQAATGMIREHNLNHLAKLIVYIIKRIIRVEFAAIFLNDPKSKSYQLKTIRDSGVSKLEINLNYDHPFIEYIKNKKEPFFYEELPFDIRNSLDFPLAINFIVPSIVEDNLLGFVFLGEKLNHQPYTKDDATVFKTLSYQAALAINYCIFLEEFKNAQEKVFNAEKQGLIGGMAEGIAHQIRNRLNQFSIVAGELEAETEDLINNNPNLLSDYPQLKDTLNSYLEISKSIISNVKHSANIINGMLEFAKEIENKETHFTTFSLKDTITSIVEMLKIKHQIQDFPLECEFYDDDTVYGIKPQIIE